MKLSIKLISILLSAGLIAYYSCKKEYSCEKCREQNKQPIANAGNDTSITLPADGTLLDGSNSSDPDDGITGYTWRKISGPDTFNISNQTAVKTTATKLVKGIYQFELTVTDKGGLSAKDTVQVMLSAVAVINHPPIANAGRDTTITLPTNSVMLDGSRSADPDSNIVSYA